MKRKIYLFLALVVMGTGFGVAQDFKCGTGGDALDPYRNTPMAKKALAKMQEAYERRLEYKKTHPGEKSHAGPYVIPVVFHIMHDYGTVWNDFNNNKQKYLDAIDEMNYYFHNSDSNKIQPPFDQISPAMDVEFRLAKIDPDGNCTEGFTVTQTEATLDATNDNIKPLIWWNNRMYLNVWIVQNIESGAGAWSHLPGTISDSYDGIVCRNNQLDALAHEAGHWLGLPHPWGPTNDSGLSSNCNMDDGIADTPNCIGGVGCGNLTYSSCTDPSPFKDIYGNTIWTGDVHDNIQNVMDYNFCSNATGENFTEGQVEKMYLYLDSTLNGRRDLWKASNLAATGTADTSGIYTCAPVPNFQYSTDVVCQGSTVDFTAESYNGTVDKYYWDFGDGDTSNVQDPTHTYNTAGTFSVSLTVSNSAGSNTETKTNIVEVRPTSGGPDVPFIESFEYNGFPDTEAGDPIKEWTLTNGSIASWRIDSSGIAYNGDNCLSLKLSSIPKDYEYVLTSPTFDFSDLGGRKCTDLSFRYAYAHKSISNTDILEVWYSRDCGEKWTQIGAYGGSSMSTSSDGDPVDTVYVPAPNEWKKEEISMAGAQFYDHVLIKFVLTTGGGNYFYLDAVNIGCDSTLGVQETIAAQLDIVPNPFSDNAKVNLKVLNSESMSVNILDPMGRLVYSESRKFSKGNYTYDLDELLINEKKGMYFIQVSSPNGSISRKAIKL